MSICIFAFRHVSLVCRADVRYIVTSLRRYVSKLGMTESFRPFPLSSLSPYPYVCEYARIQCSHRLPPIAPGYLTAVSGSVMQVTHAIVSFHSYVSRHR